MATALLRLDDLADGADFLVGHNLIAYDAPQLQAVNPGLRLLQRPMVDTLRLNPLAFPRNPYHYLVKHDQEARLRRGSINNPELDAKTTLETFDNQLKAFSEAPPDLLLLLLTAHRAKGLEFDHVVVLDGGWNRFGRGEDADAPRRLYYVAMTRARQTLTLARFAGHHPLQDALPDTSSVLRRAPVDRPPPVQELSRRYRRLKLSDVVLSFAGYRQANHPVHAAIAALSPGDRLDVRADAGRWEFVNSGGVAVGRTASGFKPPEGMRCAFASVMGVVAWGRDWSEPQYRDHLRCDAWEVVVPEMVFEPDSGTD